MVRAVVGVVLLCVSALAAADETPTERLEDLDAALSGRFKRRFAGKVDGSFVFVSDGGRAKLARHVRAVARARDLLRSELFDARAPGSDEDASVPDVTFFLMDTGRKDLEGLVSFQPWSVVGKSGRKLMPALVHVLLEEDFRRAPPWLHLCLESLFARSTVVDGHLVGLPGALADTAEWVVNDAAIVNELSRAAKDDFLSIKWNQAGPEISEEWRTLSAMADRATRQAEQVEADGELFRFVEEEFNAKLSVLDKELATAGTLYDSSTGLDADTKKR